MSTSRIRIRRPGGRSGDGTDWPSRSRFGSAGRIDSGGAKSSGALVQEAAAIRREIAATVAAAKTPKSRLKEMTRARHATEAKKPYADLAATSAPAQEKLDPDRPRRVFPVEDW